MSLPPTLSRPIARRALAILVFGFGMLIVALVEGNVPERSHLTEITGHIHSLEKVTSKGGRLSAIRFTLANDRRAFHYLAKGGDIAGVWSALERADRPVLTIAFDPNDAHTPPFDSRTYYQVLELRLGDRTIRSYQAVATSWQADNSLGDTLGYGTMFMGVALLLSSFLHRKGISFI